jgi:hypothetical protein
MYEIAKNYVTIDDILSKISQEELWTKYLGFQVQPKKLFLSPIREETDPSANLYYSNSGDLLLKDFRHKAMNIWTFVQFKYGLSFKDALFKIYNDLNLKTSPVIYTPTAQKTLRSYTDLKIKVIEWEDRHLEYWQKYHISKETLQLYRVVPIAAMWINDNYVNLRSQLAFSFEFDLGRRKIYCPYSANFKFISNVPGDCYSGFDQLPWIGDVVLLTKSHKDVMAYHELGYPAISAQGEAHKIPYEFIQLLRKRFKNIIVNYDNDQTGIDSAEILKADYQLPFFLFKTHKDCSDTIDNTSLESTKLFVDSEINKILQNVYN